MHVSQGPWCQAALLVLLLRDMCIGQRLVEMTKGPLYRVKGFPMSLSCNVSGFKGPDQQEFSFSVYKLAHPDRELHMVHTADPDFAYNVFAPRVASKDIVIERRSGSSVTLHLASLRAEDAGTFECVTPNTDGLFFGTYNAKTTVNVIEDTLVALYSGPASHSVFEGASLQLECQVSSQTFQHTHLSVTWCVQGPTQTHPIITLDKDLIVRPGPNFEDRYRSGHIGIEKVEDATYRLRISETQQTDSGEIYCQADEWILDPSRSWMRIAYKNASGSSVKVEALDVTSDADAFISHIEAVTGDLQEGAVLEIRCRVEAKNLQMRFFSMTWLKNKMEVAQIGPSGVLSVFGDYTRRQNKGELTAEKISDKGFVLTIRPITAGDQGQYQCRASQEERTNTGLFIRGESQTSPEEAVHFTPKESSLAVVVVPELLQVTEGETLQFTCRVSGASEPMSVSWKHKKATGSSFSDIVSLSTEGVMEDIGALYQQRGVRTFRPNSTDFTLEISRAMVSDSGVYMCTVMENSSGSRKGSSQSMQASVSVYSVDSRVTVVLRSRDTNAFENSTIRMICSVLAPKVALAVTWKFQPLNSDTQKDIVCVQHTGIVSCGREQRDYQLETQLHESGATFVLTLLRASRRLQGQYQCQIDAYQNDLQKAKKVSNELGITVHTPVSKMSVFTLPSSRLETPVNSNAKVDCLVSSPTFSSSRFGVTWMNGDLTVLKMNPEGVLVWGPSSQDLDQRISLVKTETQSFQLTVQQVRSTEGGFYHCLVEEWVQDPDGIWYQLQQKNATMELVVTEKVRDFSLNKVDSSLSVTEGEMVALRCSLHTAPLDSVFHYSLSWFFEKQDKKTTSKLLTYSYDGRLQFHNTALQGRLQFFRPTERDFQLSILSSAASDSGRYSCQVDQYQLDCGGKWELKASDMSGLSHVSVNFIGSKLQVLKVNQSLNITDLHMGFTVECEITSRSSEASVFQVSWLRRQGGERPLTIFTASKDGTLHSSMKDRRLVFDRPSLSVYSLTVPDVTSSDNGQYQCEVQEWLQTPTNSWRKVSEDKSGERFIHVESEDKPGTGTFILKESHTHLNTTEGQQFDLSCSINVDKWDPKLHYTVTWYVERMDSSSRSFLLKHTFDGHLLYQSENLQLKTRLQFSRPTDEQFHLIVLSSSPSDSGRYICEVDQHHLNCEGEWEKRGSSQSRSIMVAVQTTGSKLQVQKVNQSLNITDLHMGFTVECEITSRSSEASVFEVSWLRRQGGERPLTIFTASKDGTLQSSMKDRRLVFDRPSLSVYSLTVPDVTSSDNGQYQCEVQEWLQTPTNSWRKVSEDKSGELSIQVHAEGNVVSSNTGGIILGICLPIIFILVMVIVILLKILQKTTFASKKQSNSLWAENNPLKPFTETSKHEESSMCE